MAGGERGGIALAGGRRARNSFRKGGKSETLPKPFGRGVVPWQAAGREGGGRKGSQRKKQILERRGKGREGGGKEGGAGGLGQARPWQEPLKRHQSVRFEGRPRTRREGEGELPWGEGRARRGRPRGDPPKMPNL